MDMLFILRDALASSLMGSLLMALKARQAGLEVGVLFTQEALAAAAGGVFEWPRELAGQEMRLGLADRGAGAGLPRMGSGQGRQLDVKGLIAEARHAGVVLYACPIWASLLDVGGKLPDGFQAPDEGAVVKLLQEAKKVIGTL